MTNGGMNTRHKRELIERLDKESLIYNLFNLVDYLTCDKEYCALSTEDHFERAQDRAHWFLGIEEFEYMRANPEERHWEKAKESVKEMYYPSNDEGTLFKEDSPERKDKIVTQKININYVASEKDYTYEIYYTNEGWITCDLFSQGVLIDFHKINSKVARHVAGAILDLCDELETYSE